MLRWKRILTPINQQPWNQYFIRDLDDYSVLFNVQVVFLVLIFFRINTTVKCIFKTRGDRTWIRKAIGKEKYNSLYQT